MTKRLFEIDDSDTWLRHSSRSGLCIFADKRQSGYGALAIRNKFESHDLSRRNIIRHKFFAGLRKKVLPFQRWEGAHAAQPERPPIQSHMNRASLERKTYKRQMVFFTLWPRPEHLAALECAQILAPLPP